MPELPESMMEVLENAAESVSAKAIQGVTVQRFDLPHVPIALGKARREGSSDQVPLALYAPARAPALLILEADDLESLLVSVEQTARRGEVG